MAGIAEEGWLTAIREFRQEFGLGDMALSLPRSRLPTAAERADEEPAGEETADDVCQDENELDQFALLEERVG